MDQEKRRQWILMGLLLVGGVLRLAMIEAPAAPGSESAVYVELGRNLLQHGTFGLAHAGVVQPSMARMPGYPLLLALLGGHLQWMMVLQASLDLLGYTLLTRYLWRWSGERAGDLALTLGALCAFTAACAATLLPESLSTFAVMLGICSLGQMMLTKSPGWLWALPVAGAGALAMLLRPEGILLALALAGGVAWHGRERWGTPRALQLASLVGLLSALPLLPWLVRNWLVFHVFQPLAPWSGDSIRLAVLWPQHRALFLAAALLGLAIASPAAMGFARRLVPFGGWMFAYLLVRCALLVAVGSSGLRGMIELFPLLMVGAACWLGGRHAGRWGLRSTVQAGESDLAELFAESFPVAERGNLHLVERP